MDVFRVDGGISLQGEVAISGSKNAALPLLAACLLTEEKVKLTNIPNLSDIRYMIEILKFLGASAEKQNKGRELALSALQMVELLRK